MALDQVTNEQIEQEHQEEAEMSFLDHVEVLRWHLIRIFVAIFVAAIVAFIYPEFIFDAVLFGPLKESFFTYKVMCKASFHLSQLTPYLIEADTLCFGRDLPKLQNLEVSGQFTSHILISMVAGLILAFPYVVWEIWRFIKPALSVKERRYSKGFLFFTSALFLSGVLFAYYIIFPLSVNFLLTYQVSDSLQNIPQFSSYNSLMINTVLGCGFLFELPVFIYFLAKLGVVTGDSLKQHRKIALVICLILAAIITPSPDVFSQILVTFPLMFLFELGIFIAYRVEVSAQD